MGALWEGGVRCEASSRRPAGDVHGTTRGLTKVIAEGRDGDLRGDGQRGLVMRRTVHLERGAVIPYETIFYPLLSYDIRQDTSQPIP
jgi:hypothetical protein